MILSIHVRAMESSAPSTPRVGFIYDNLCFVSPFVFYLISESAITRCRSDPLSYFASTNIFLILRGGETKQHPLVQSNHHLPVTHPLVTVAPSTFSSNTTNTNDNASFVSSSTNFCCIRGFGSRFSRFILRRKGKSVGSRISIHFFCSRFDFTIFDIRVFASDSRAFPQGYCRIGLGRSNRISLQS